MKKYYFTFGMKHFAPAGGSRAGLTLGRNYVTIEAEDYETARALMFERYGDQWAMSYQEEEYEDCIKRYDLIEYEYLIQQSKSAS